MPCCAEVAGVRARVEARASGEGGPGAAAVAGVTALLLPRTSGLPAPADETRPLLLPPADHVAPGEAAAGAVVLATGASVVVELLPRKQKKINFAHVHKLELVQQKIVIQCYLSSL